MFNILKINKKIIQNSKIILEFKNFKPYNILHVKYKQFIANFYKY